MAKAKTKELLEGAEIEAVETEVAEVETPEELILDFAGGNFSTQPFKKRKFVGYDFTNSIFQGCDFTGSTFKDCKFDNTDVRWSIGFPDDITEGVVK